MCPVCPPPDTSRCFLCGDHHREVALPAHPHASLSDMPGEITAHILGFHPDSARVLLAASRSLREISKEFLKEYAKEIATACSDADSPLYRCVQESFIDFSLRLWFQPGQGGLQFHLSIPNSIRRLNDKIECPDKILSPREIQDFHQRILDGNLKKIWPGMIRPTREGMPNMDAPAEAIAAWMHADEQQPLLQTFVARLELGYHSLSSVPMEIRLCSNLLELNLSNNALFFLPEGIFQGLSALRLLHLSGNQLTTLPGGLFHGLEALERLFLSQNQLASLPEELFHGLASLWQLDLSVNQLLSLSETAFQGLTALQELSLLSNHLVSLPENLLQGMTVLRELQIEQNRLTSLPERGFQDLHALVNLYLSSNRLTSLPENLLRGPAALQGLYLSGNQLISLPDTLLHGLTALRTLNLGLNKLRTLSPGAFQGLTSLKGLALNCNQLVILPEDLFQGLQALWGLRLDTNPLLMVSCNYDWSRDRQMSVAILDTMRAFFSYRCFSPLAALCQQVARGASADTAKSLFAQLPEATKDSLVRMIPCVAGHSEDPQWRDQHAFDDMEIFARVLQNHLRITTFNGLSMMHLGRPNAVYTHVYKLAILQDGERRVHADVPIAWSRGEIPWKWGKLHAHDNVLRLIDALHAANQQRGQ